MLRQAYDIVAPVRGEAYRQLLEFARTMGLRFGLARRQSLKYHEPADSILASLEDHIVWSRSASSWPGTELIGGGQADVALFTTNDVTIELLSRFADGLFDWCGPQRPEDVWFEASDGDVILATIAHEKDGYMRMTDEEFESLRSTGFPVDQVLTRAG
jgi:hypothetical protein